MQAEDSLHPRLGEFALYFQSCNLRQPRLTEVSLYFQSRNLSQSRLTDVLPSLHPRPPIASQMRLRILSACPCGYVSFEGADKETCSFGVPMRLRVLSGCNVASSARHKNPQISSLIFLIMTSSGRPLIASFEQPFFPSLRSFMYNKHISTLDRATLMYATGRPSNVHFLAARGSLSSVKPFVGKAFLTQKTGASAASNVAQGSCAHQTIHYP